AAASRRRWRADAMLVPADAYILDATAYTETTLILFPHLLAAMATVGGALGVLNLCLRARGAVNATELRTTVCVLELFGRPVLLPPAGLAGVIGLLLAHRYDGRGVFSFSHQGWLFVAIVYPMEFQPFVRS